MNRTIATFLTAALIGLASMSPERAAAQPHEGFGAATPGGTGKTIYRVTNLNNSGAGSLRDAVSQSNRYIVFDVAGTITLGSHLVLEGKSFITIDGSTAPSPGITLQNNGIELETGTHDIVIKHLRIRNSSNDGIAVYNAHDVLIDHVSVHGSSDGSIDITEGAYNVTVQWSLLARPGSGNMLIKYSNPRRITVHHNLFTASSERNPQVRIDEAGTSATELTADIRNNVVWGWASSGAWGYGQRVYYGAWANVVNNFYQSAGSPGLALEVSNGGRAYTSGNISGNGINVNIGNVSTPFAAAAVATDPTCTAALKVVQQAGMRPLDAIDEDLVADVSLAACPGGSTPPPPAAPSGLTVR